MSGYVLGVGSRRKLLGVHPDLIAVVCRAIEITVQDFAVIEGVRTRARQMELYAQGRTAPGPVVTWTKNSRHFVQADGWGHAVDLAPYPIDWSVGKKFDDVAAAMLAAAKELGVGVQWGGNWSTPDRPHFELEVKA